MIAHLEVPACQTRAPARPASSSRGVCRCSSSSGAAATAGQESGEAGGMEVIRGALAHLPRVALAAGGATHRREVGGVGAAMGGEESRRELAPPHRPADALPPRPPPPHAPCTRALAGMRTCSPPPCTRASSCTARRQRRQQQPPPMAAPATAQQRRSTARASRSCATQALAMWPACWAPGCAAAWRCRCAWPTPTGEAGGMAWGLGGAGAVSRAAHPAHCTPLHPWTPPHARPPHRYPPPPPPPPPRELQYVLEDAGVTQVLATPRHLERMQRLAQARGQGWCVCGGGGAGQGGRGGGRLTRTHALGVLVVVVVQALPSSHPRSTPRDNPPHPAAPPRCPALCRVGAPGGGGRPSTAGKARRGGGEGRGARRVGRPHPRAAAGVRGTHHLH